MPSTRRRWKGTKQTHRRLKAQDQCIEWNHQTTRRQREIQNKQDDRFNHMTTMLEQLVQNPAVEEKIQRPYNGKHTKRNQPDARGNSRTRAGLMKLMLAIAMLIKGTRKLRQHEECTITGLENTEKRYRETVSTFERLGNKSAHIKYHKNTRTQDWKANAYVRRQRYRQREEFVNMFSQCGVARRSAQGKSQNRTKRTHRGAWAKLLMWRPETD